MKRLEEYCKNTTLHGLRYVGDSGLSYGERIFWFISFSLAIMVSAYYIMNIFTTWTSSPVIISFSPYDLDLSSIPFPAITICNINRVKKDKAERILKNGTNLEKKLLNDACGENSTFENVEQLTWDHIKNFFVEVGSSCSDMLGTCWWGNEEISCDKLFTNDLLDDGLCCSFNRLPPDMIYRNYWKNITNLNKTNPSKVYDWDSKTGFKDLPTDDDSLPRRPLGAGAHLGLSVTLDAKLDNYYCSSGRSVGFKVSIFPPLKTPKVAEYAYLTSPGYETRISINPTIHETLDTLLDMPVEKRLCLLPFENHLKYYRKYSEKNCHIECLSDNILLHCGCIPHYLPSNSSTRICDLNDECIIRTRGLLRNEQQILKNNSSDSHKCFCPASCFNVQFPALMSRAPIRTFSNNLKYTNKYFWKNIAKLRFYFETTRYFKQGRRPRYTYTDMLSYTGGLLALFIGFSFLSVVEILFHTVWLTWKKIMNIKNKQKRSYNKNTFIKAPEYPFLN